ncbi:MAG TPA: hypothetical protein ENG74_03855, partial [Thermoplasmatales archaeon]|nr:hypothetical protein [Thermoplasmatales archaeon]
MKKEIWYSLIMVSILGGALVVALMDVPTGTSFRYEIKTFDSYEDLRSHIQSRYMSCYLPSYYMPSAKPYAGKTSLENALDGGCNDFSKTNIQVEGVDEADIVKTDGTYIYIIANNCLYIIFAYPASDAEILSKIEFSENLYLRELYIDNDKVIVIAESWRMIDLYNDSKEESSDYVDVIPYPISIPSTTIRIYDVSDRKNPELIKDVSIDGYYFDSRMIDGKVYLVSVEESYYIFPTDSIINIPEIRIDDSVYKIPAEEIYYPDIPNTNADSLTHIVAIDINDGTFDEKSFLIDYSQNMYVSKDSIYITTIKYPVRPLLVSP